MNITLIGSGNVATWMAQRLQNSAKFRITTVYSRNIENALKVAALSGARATDNVENIDKNADLYILSLSDSAYEDFLSRLDFKMKSAFMTSGTVSCRCLEGKSGNYGVIYPLQTLTKTQDMRNIEVPLCVESVHAGSMSATLRDLCSELSPSCEEVSEEQRASIHLAAVFACNFSNAMYTIADKILSDNNLNLSLLLPLLKNTVAKLEEMPPREAQTGPAARGDRNVMERHLESLSDKKIRELYTLVSDFIMNQKSC
ncbi:MAG: Rossmann-like and DUF2520 domain-containing protein [Bacteroidales bacterium]|nr:Rossmann-like and DUF2520 domain-containing protein [Bacteroidales bacterium]